MLLDDASVDASAKAAYEVFTKYATGADRPKLMACDCVPWERAPLGVRDLWRRTVRAAVDAIEESYKVMVAKVQNEALAQQQGKPAPIELSPPTRSKR